MVTWNEKNEVTNSINNQVICGDIIEELFYATEETSLMPLDPNIFQLEKNNVTGQQILTI